MVEEKKILIRPCALRQQLATNSSMGSMPTPSGRVGGGLKVGHFPSANGSR
jgi:hypothetical protein